MIGRALTRGLGELRSVTLSEPDWLLDLIGGSRTYAGPKVDELSALRHAAVGACVRVVSEDIGKVPCIVYERTGPKSRERAPYDAYAPALGLSPNPEMTAIEYWENLTAYSMLWGRGPAYIERVRNGTVALWPLPPNRVEIAREKMAGSVPGKVAPGPIIGINVTLDNGEKRFVKWRDVIMQRAFGYDPETPIRRHRETIGLGLAAEEFGSRFFGQGGSTGGFIKMPVEATPAQADRTEARYRAKHEGLERSHLVGILEGGAEWQEVGMPLKDAQYIDGRQFGVEEVARIFRVPLHKVQHLLRATFSNIEESNIDYVVDTLSPWCIRHEQAHRTKLYGLDTYGAVGDRYPEFLLDGLLRGDQEGRYKAYALAINWGWMSRSEVRERENLPHEEELDDFLVPLNMNVAGEEVDPEEEPIRRLAAALARHTQNGNGHGPSDPAPTVLPEVAP